MDAYCSSCGTYIAPDYIFCPKCGKKYDGLAEAVPLQNETTPKSDASEILAQDLGKTTTANHDNPKNNKKKLSNTNREKDTFSDPIPAGWILVGCGKKMKSIIIKVDKVLFETGLINLQIRESKLRIRGSEYRRSFDHENRVVDIWFKSQGQDLVLFWLSSHKMPVSMPKCLCLLGSGLASLLVALSLSSMVTQTIQDLLSFPSAYYSVFDYSNLLTGICFLVPFGGGASIFFGAYLIYAIYEGLKRRDWSTAFRIDPDEKDKKNMAMFDKYIGYLLRGAIADLDLDQKSVIPIL
jgi:hypothetical protein